MDFFENDHNLDHFKNHYDLLGDLDEFGSYEYYDDSDMYWKLTKKKLVLNKII